MDGDTLAPYRADCVTRTAGIDPRIVAMIAAQEAALPHKKPASLKEKIPRPSGSFSARPTIYAECRIMLSRR